MRAERHQWAREEGETRTTDQRIQDAGMTSIHTSPDGACFFWSIMIASGMDRTTFTLQTKNPLRARTQAGEYLRGRCREARREVYNWLRQPSNLHLFQNEPLYGPSFTQFAQSKIQSASPATQKLLLREVGITTPSTYIDTSLVMRMLQESPTLAHPTHLLIKP